MAHSIKLSPRYGSFIPALIASYRRTEGDIVEFGGGVYSTHYLHWLCFLDNRKLTTYENTDFWYEWCSYYHSKSHKIVKVDDWNTLDVSGSWSIAFVDLSPDSMRKEIIKKLVDNTQLVVAHDSNGRYNSIYHYDEIYPLYKHRYIFDQTEPATVVLSNIDTLENFL